MNPPFTRRDRQVARSEYLAGWIFADILLVMMLVAFGTQGPVPEVPKPVPSPTPTHSASASPSPKPTKHVIAMLPDPKAVQIRVDVGDLLAGGKARATQYRRIDQQIKKKTASFARHRAGLVLVWGRAPRVQTGQAIAHLVSDRLKKARPAMFEDAAKPRELWRQDDAGTVLLEIFLFA